MRAQAVCTLAAGRAALPSYVVNACLCGLMLAASCDEGPSKTAPLDAPSYGTADGAAPPTFGNDGGLRDAAAGDDGAAGQGMRADAGVGGRSTHPFPCPPMGTSESCFYGRVTSFSSDNALPSERTVISLRGGTCGIDGQPACPCVRIFEHSFRGGPLGQAGWTGDQPEATLDTDGRWLISGVPLSGTGFDLVAVDDCASSAEDDWVFTMILAEQRYEYNDLSEDGAVVITTAERERWGMQPGPEPLPIEGSFIAIFRDAVGAPVPGVVPVAEPTPARGVVTYFGDTLDQLDPNRPLSQGTRASGAALISPAFEAQWSGMGAGISWEPIVGVTSYGAYLVHRFRGR